MEFLRKKQPFGGDMRRYFFKTKQRLTTNTQFRAALAHKCCVSNDLFRLYVCPNDLDHPRLGLSVSRKCGNAVRRNRLKRLAREAFRLSAHDIPSNYDYLLIYKPNWSKNTNEPRTAPKNVGIDRIKRLFTDSATRAVEISRQKTSKRN